jgi:uncharacterized protein YydD (DUF2326 family)
MRRKKLLESLRNLNIRSLKSLGELLEVGRRKERIIK